MEHWVWCVNNLGTLKRRNLKKKERERDFGISIAFLYPSYSYLYMNVTPTLDKELLQTFAKQIPESMKV